MLKIGGMGGEVKAFCRSPGVHSDAVGAFLPCLILPRQRSPGTRNANQARKITVVQAAIPPMKMMSDSKGARAGLRPVCISCGLCPSQVK